MNIDKNQISESEQIIEEQGVLWKQPITGYKIVSCISGNEDYGVFVAHDTRLDRNVIIKTLTADLENNEDAIERFFNEARQVARIKHNNIARGLDVGRSGKLFYFVMEYLKGESLEEKLTRLQNGRLREVDSLTIVEGVANALDQILKNGLVHRDLKPSNVFLTNDGEVKITDLGIAKDVAYASTADQLRRSPDYVSPEQASEEVNIDIRSDLYSLGCIWYRMVLGTPPFTSETPDIILRKHISDDPDSVTEVDPRISPATSQLINWLLTKDRDRRPKSPHQFLSKLMTHPIIKLKQEKEINSED